MTVISNRTELAPRAPEGADVGLVRVAPVSAWPTPGGARQPRFAYARADGDAAGIWLSSAGALGGDERVVAAEGFRAEELSWSPDAQRLAFGVGGGPPPGGTRHVAWAAAAPLAGEAGRVAGAAFAWTPKGGALIVADLAKKKVVRCDAATGATQPLADIDDDGDPHFAPRISVSPDGARIAFTCRRVKDDISEVWLIHRDDAGAVKTAQITQIPGAAVRVQPFWSPKGITLGMHIVHLEQEKSAVVVLPRLEGEGEILYESDLLDAAEAPAWSPSGRGIVLFRAARPHHELTKSGPQELVLLDVKARTWTPLTEAGGPSGPLRFLDDRTLAIEGGPAASLLTFATAP